ncbi:hypothetical protein TNCV_3102501 [Trichonephila clavipes]|nr:hypothetical protein TNCV_3102501 [Trichonephila clavipes]
MDPTYQQRTIQTGRGSVMNCYRGAPGSLCELWTIPLSKKSTDMSVIERILDTLQRSVQKRSPPLLSPTDLWTPL